MVDANAATTVAGARDSPSYVFALWNLVIRPPRASYELSQLGPAEFEIRGQRASRKDVRLRTSRGLHIVGSHFIPRKRDGSSLGKTPVVIYLHGNSSNRLEAGSLVASFISRRIQLFCYDACGCGLSEGEYVSLGWHERDDLATVIEYLRKSPTSGAIGLWGRSMGAVTALMHADRDPSIGALCVDSPFASLRELVMELAQSEHVAIYVPTWLLEVVLSFVRMRVKTLANFDIDDLVPLNHVTKSFVPSLFVHGREDSFIMPKHSQRLFDAYAGDAEMLMITGDHNSERGSDCIDRVCDFFCRGFRYYAHPLTLPLGAAPARVRHSVGGVGRAVSEGSPGQRPQTTGRRASAPAPGSTYIVKVVRNESGCAGLTYNPSMTINEVFRSRPDLQPMKPGDSIIAVNGSPVKNKHEYASRARGVKEFTLTLRRGKESVVDGGVPQEPPQTPLSKRAGYENITASAGKENVPRAPYAALPGGRAFFGKENQDAQVSSEHDFRGSRGPKSTVVRSASDGSLGKFSPATKTLPDHSQEQPLAERNVLQTLDTSPATATALTAPLGPPSSSTTPISKMGGRGLR